MLSILEATNWLAARGLVSAVAPGDSLTEVQSSLSGALHTALSGDEIDVDTLDPIEPEELARALAGTPTEVRHQLVRDMVLGELVLVDRVRGVGVGVPCRSDSLGGQR